MVAFPTPLIRSAFYTTVWKIVREIPAGRVATYGQIAAMIPCPPGFSPVDYPSYRARLVGEALAACPTDVPWQRVINSQGKISLRPGAELQRNLLEAEGVSFDLHNRVDLGDFGWPGPLLEWLIENRMKPPDQSSFI